MPREEEIHQDLAGAGALADPIRRSLYLYVCAQPHPVSRDQAADAVEVPVHTAKFHLDKLEQAGLLRSTYARTTGRTGPGAGRSAKLYERSQKTIEISLPQREYALAGELMARAISEASVTGESVSETLARAAAAEGERIGAEHVAGSERAARDDATDDGATDDGAAGGDAHGDQTAGDQTTGDQTTGAAWGIALSTLREMGYEPRVEGEAIVMANCPFHQLAGSHTDLVCGMNHDLLTGFVGRVAPGEFEARLDPAPGRCCVTICPCGRGDGGGCCGESAEQGAPQRESPSVRP